MASGVVLCPVDFTDVSERELALAIEVCSTFGSRLVLHHNLTSAPIGLTRDWEWNKLHQAGYISEDESIQRLSALLAAVPATVEAEATVSHGPIGLVLMEMAERLPADLVVLGYHGLRDLDHASVTERMIEHGACPVLALPEHAAISGFALRGEPVPVLVPADLSDAAVRVIDYAAELARRSAIRLHLLHVASGTTREAALEDIAATLRGTVAADVRDSVIVHVERGNTVSRIVEAAARINAAFVLMGEHHRGLLARLFLTDTAQSVLGRAACPVWYVPPKRRG
jgi:universal stress protein A